MQMRYTKEQGQHDEAVQEFLNNGGKISKVQPALAKGSEASRVTKRDVAKARAAFRRGES